jgi:hypothetical protein
MWARSCFERPNESTTPAEPAAAKKTASLAAIQRPRARFAPALDITRDCRARRRFPQPPFV